MHKEFIQKLTNLVEANLANEKFGPEELAREAGMSHSNLNRKLKSISSKNVSQFIREVRLKKAKELLQNEDATVAEISYRVGFGSPTYFNKCFHEYFGYAPGELRNKEEEEEFLEQPVEATPIKHNRKKILFASVVMLVVLIPSTYFLTKTIVKDNILDKSIAVLPFKYLGDDAEKQYLADGMMDAITFNLSKIKDLRVISKTSVEQYRDTKKTTNTIGKELDVSYILEGSFQKQENQIRLIVQLIRTKNEDHIWSEIYDREWADIFSVQSEVAETVAGELEAKITPNEKQFIRKVPTKNLTAYDFYQRGVHILAGNTGVEKYFDARRQFNKALEYDSTFAEAYIGLATIYWTLHDAETYFTEIYPDSVLIFDSMALAYDDNLPDAYIQKGSRLNWIGRPAEALKEVNKGLKLDPKNWRGLAIRSSIVSNGFNDFIESISDLIQSVKLNRGGIELPYLLENLSKEYIYAGFVDKAKQVNQELLELVEDTGWFYIFFLKEIDLANGNYENVYKMAKEINDTVNIIWYSSMMGRDEEAFQYAEKYAENNKETLLRNNLAASKIGYAYHQAVKTREAQYFFDLQIKLDLQLIKVGRFNSASKSTHYSLAEVYAFTGDKEKAYQYLDEFNKKQAFPLWWVTLFKHDPFFNSIRKEPRFEKILKDVEGKYQKEHERTRKWLEEQKIL